MILPNRIVLTPGEPAGIGPDITVQIAQLPWAAELVAIAHPDLLLARAKQLGLPLRLVECDIESAPTPHEVGTLKCISIPLTGQVKAGKLQPIHAPYVIETLEKAAALCLSQHAQAVVTGPVQKSVINEAGIPFKGHTEFFADVSRVKQTVMLFVVDQLKVALATTHLPLREVPDAIQKDRLRSVLSVLQTGLKKQFGLTTPRILVCGLNPHAGENGYLGREEIDIITPLLNELRGEGYLLEGPLPADTLFTPKQLQRGDAVLAMYHDQALPLVKYIGFSHAVNVTLGLPFIRTSVDHGTALDVAGTGKADAGSLQAAIQLAIALASR